MDLITKLKKSLSDKIFVHIFTYIYINTHTVKRYTINLFYIFAFSLEYTTYKKRMTMLVKSSSFPHGVKWIF